MKTFNKRISIFFILLFICLQFISCAQDNQKIYFKINPEDRKIIIPILINKGVPANMLFDTGTPLGSFSLDSNFYHSENNLTSKYKNAFESKVSTAWTYPESRLALFFEEIITANFVDKSISYNNFFITDYKIFLNNNRIDGVFNIPKNDSLHIWELNFENNYLSIHNATNFKRPMKSIWLTLSYNENNQLCVELPLKIRTANGDMLNFTKKFIIDSASPNDISIIGVSKELDFFNNIIDCIWLANNNSYIRKYKVRAELCNRYTFDPFYIYTYDNLYKSFKLNVIGINFLKRFNVFFDMKNMQLGLKPINNYIRVANPNTPHFYYSVYQTPDTNIRVRKVADYPTNCYKKAGLQEGDIIVALNNEPIIKVIKENRLKPKVDTLTFDIVRKGKSMKIIVPTDKNEEKGD